MMVHAVTKFSEHSHCVPAMFLLAKECHVFPLIRLCMDKTSKSPLKLGG